MRSAAPQTTSVGDVMPGRRPSKPGSAVAAPPYTWSDCRFAAIAAARSAGSAAGSIRNLSGLK